MSLTIRTGTNDDVIFDNVVTRNEYRLAERLHADSIVLDIGAHAGFFSYHALTRGASRVYLYEPVESNRAAARLNLAEFGDRAVISDKAVWRSDVQVSSLSFWPSSDPLNAGGGTVIWETDGAPVEAVAFDDVVASLVQRHQRRIDLLKIDCEGSEFPILLTSRRLGDIAQIVGEYHELRATPPTHARVPGIEQFRLEDLTDALGRQGFLVEHEKQAEGTFGALGLFFARRVHDK